MDDELMRERARYEALAALVDNYRRERDEARAEAERLSESAKAAWEAECVMREQRDRYHAEWKQERQEVERLRIERDEARAEVERLKAEAASSLAMARIADEKHGWKCAEVEVLRGVGCNEDGDGSCGVCRKCAYRRGAEAMREACAGALYPMFDTMRDYVRALPIPEEP